MKKQVVSEIDIVSGTIDSPKGFEIDRDKIKNDIITSFINQSRISNNEKDFAYFKKVIRTRNPSAIS